MKTKKWYESKLVILNVIQTLIGALTLAAEYMKAGDLSPAGMTMLVVGILGVILRVWYTNTSIS